jgi:hypothetical protein
LILSKVARCIVVIEPVVRIKVESSCVLTELAVYQVVYNSRLQRTWKQYVSDS